MLRRKFAQVFKKEFRQSHKMEDLKKIHRDQQIAVDFKDVQLLSTDKISSEIFIKKTDLQSIKADSTKESTMANKIAIFWHEDCLLHKIVNHPEQPDRAAFILTALRQKYPEECFHSAPSVKDSQILLFHTPEHLSMLKKLFETSESAFNKNNKKDMYRSIDGDTVVMWRTRKAVYRAAGSVIAAIDALFLPDHDTNKIMAAFCCVRPPGHHAHRGKAGGFCFMNNAGIGARYAQTFCQGVKKVAVLDFDVHHGDGVEEGFTPHENLFYGSTHEKDNFPGTGTDPSPFVGENARRPVDRRIVNRTINRGPNSVMEFHCKWVEVIEEMILFKPDLIIISAGFDAHDEDPLASCELLDDDFVWATEVIMEAALRLNPHSPVPVMSVLEGGYDLPALASSALAHVNVLAKGHYLSKTNRTEEADSNVILEKDVNLEDISESYEGDITSLYISGQILELHDLVLTEMNNVRVEIIGMRRVVNRIQYFCLFLRNKNENHWINECNIRKIPMSTFSELKTYGDLKDEIQDIIGEIRESESLFLHERNLLLREASAQIEMIKIMNPAEGEIYVMEAEVARISGMEVALLAPILRRACANLDESDEILKLKALYDYSGVLSTLNDLSGENEQLSTMIEKYNYEDCDTFHSLLANNLILQRKIQEAMIILKNLNSKMTTKGLKRSYLTPTRIEEEILVSMLNQVEVFLCADLKDNLELEEYEDTIREMALLEVSNDQG